MLKSAIKWYHYIPSGVAGLLYGYHVPLLDNSLLFFLGLVGLVAINSTIMFLADHYYQTRERTALKKG